MAHAEVGRRKRLEMLISHSKSPWPVSVFTHHSVVCISFGFTFSSSSFRHSPHHFLLFSRCTFQQTYDRSFFLPLQMLLWAHHKYERGETEAVFYSVKITIRFSLSIKALSAMDFTCW